MRNMLRCAIFAVMSVLISGFVTCIAQPNFSDSRESAEYVKKQIQTADSLIVDNPQKGLDFVNEALKLLDRYPDKKLEAQALIVLCKIERNLGHDQAAFVTIHRILSSDDEEFIKIRGLAYLERGILYQKMGDYVNAYDDALTALDIFEEHGDYKQICRIKCMIAQIYKLLGDFKTAYRFFNEALNITTEYELKELYIETLLGLSRVYLDGNEPDKARERLLEVLQHDTSHLHRAQAYFIMGQTYMDQHEWDQALTTDSLALAHAQYADNLYLQSVVNNDIAYIYKIRDDYQKSLEYNNKALALRKEMGNPELIASALRNIATLHADYGFYVEAIRQFENALDIAVGIDQHEIQIDIQKKLSDIYAILGDHQTALHYLTAHIKLKDDSFDESVIHNVRQLQLDYMLEKKETENELLRRNILIHELEHKRQNIMLFSGLIIFVLFIIILILLFKRYKHSMKLTEILDEKVKERTSELREEIEVRRKVEQEVRKSLREKEVLVREIHHRVKNNLQLISSLLNLQEDEIETKEDALKAFENSRLRIISMAQIYDKLYESKLLSEIELSSYIEQLTSILLYSNREANKISFEHRLDEIRLNIDIAIPLGLILNELITNVSKHAFKGVKAGKLTILLHKKKNHYEFVVQDNGVGIPEEIDVENPTTLGLTIVSLLTQQIHGTYEIQTGNGTKIVIRFSVEGVE